jgi:hypothetical protein
MDHSKILYHNHIAIYPNAVSNDFCDALIKNFKDVLVPYKVTPRERDYSEGKDLSVKDTAIGFDLVNKEYQDYLFTEIMWETILPLYMSKYNGYRSVFYTFGCRFDGFNIQETNPGEGYHVWHHEWAPTEIAVERTLVWTLYLNDVEEGGETEFLDIPFRAKPKKGTLCIFPSAPTHQHRGNPPLSGTKYLATGWIETASKQIIVTPTNPQPNNNPPNE